MGGRRSDSVLICVQNLPVPLDRRVWLECQALVAAGLGVSVVCPRGPGDPSYELLDGVHLYKYRPPRQAEGIAGYMWEFLYCVVATFALAVKAYRRSRFRVIQVCNPPDTLFLVALPFRPLGVKLVYDQHDLCPEVFQSRFGSASTRLLRGLYLLEQATYRCAHTVVVTNASYRAVALSRGGCSPREVTVVRSGPDTTSMAPGPGSPELRNGRPHLAVYLGIMGPQDGVDGVLRAWSVIVHDMGRTDCHLAVLGFGDCFEELRALCTDLDLDPWVTFTGRADATQVQRWLRSADLGLDPDPLNPLNDVSTMNKTMEYMAFALPVVTFDLKETRISAAASAVYVRPGDIEGFAKAAVELFDDDEKRARMGSYARQRAVDLLDWDVQRARYVEVYRRLLRGETDMSVINASPSSAAPSVPEQRLGDRRTGARRGTWAGPEQRRLQRRDAISIPSPRSPAAQPVGSRSRSSGKRS